MRNPTDSMAARTANGTNRVRVLFVTNQYPTDKTPGASPCIKQQRESLERLGYSVDVLFFDGPASRWNYVKAMLRLFWLVQVRGKYDIVHAHYGFSGLVARFQLRCPVVVTFRGSDVLSARERPISRMVSSIINKSIVMTEQMKQILGREDASVIPYGIDLDFFQIRPQPVARQALGLPAEPPFIFFPYNPGRPEKRYDLVEQAFKLLKPEFPSLELLPVYNQSHQVIVNYMNACDVFVLASDTEGAPLAIREAMACNLPIVCVDAGDAAKIIEDIEGCYICSRSPEDMAEKIACVLRTRRRTNGRAAASRLELSRPASEIALIYQELL